MQSANREWYEIISNYLKEHRDCRLVFSGNANDLSVCLRTYFPLPKYVKFVVSVEYSSRQTDMQVGEKALALASEATVTLATAENQKLVHDIGLQATNATLTFRFVNQCSIESFAPLVHVKYLELLSCRDTIDWESLRFCQCLQSLLLEGLMQKGSLSSLSTLPELKWLQIVDCPCLDFSTLGSLQTLKHLKLDSLPLSKIDFLEDMTMLETVCLDQCHHIASFHPLQHIPSVAIVRCELLLPVFEKQRLCNIKSLCIVFSPITEIGSLPASITSLSITGCLSLKRLENLGNVEDLQLGLCPLVQPITNAPKLKIAEVDTIGLFSDCKDLMLEKLTIYDVVENMSFNPFRASKQIHLKLNRMLMHDDPWPTLDAVVAECDLSIDSL